MNDTLDIPRGATMALCKAGIVIGDGAKTGVGIAAPNGAGVEFAIDGIAYHKADVATNAPLTGGTVGLLSTCLFLVCVDSAGTLSFVKGDDVLTADLTAGNAVLRWPTPPAGTCPLGAVKVATASSATFIAGTTALDAADITDTYYDFGGGMPSRPLTS